MPDLLVSHLELAGTTVSPAPGWWQRTSHFLTPAGQSMWLIKIISLEFRNKLHNSDSTFDVVCKIHVPFPNRCLNGLCSG